MDAIVDTDILSTFSKINKFDLLKELFSNSKFYISNKNETELFKAKKLGYKFVERAIKFKLTKLILNKNERLEFQKLKANKKSLSLADAETLVLAKSRNLFILTNDIIIQKEADKQNVTYFNLPMVLREFWKQRILQKDDVTNLISQIEKEDSIVIVDKEAIFLD